ncbi:MAG TPA: DUF4440 domain-containing protein [Candidatus Melainabacteria bacterium]|nr:DUF4440 domain-containing protein [Candidatus Melainabacteria bacterium]
MTLRVFRLLIVLILLFFIPISQQLAGAAGKQTKNTELTVGGRSFSRSSKEIAALLANQEKAWNRGDLDAFLSGYLQSPKVTYVSNGSVKRGFDAIRQHYVSRYGTSKSSMGQLRLSDLEVSDVGDKHVLCIGKFTVFHHAHVPIYGRFSLLLVKTGGAWKIIYDHSSQ